VNGKILQSRIKLKRCEKSNFIQFFFYFFFFKMSTRIILSSQPLDIDFHPTRSLLAYSLIDGTVGIADRNKSIASLQIHTDSCRTVTFDCIDGTKAFSGSKDMSLACISIERQECISRVEDAHDTGINVIKSLSSSILASGDDSGVVKLWDERRSKNTSIFEWNDNVDFISDFAYVEAKRALLCTRFVVLNLMF
jgi:WD40 repeat protein